MEQTPTLKKRVEKYWAEQFQEILCQYRGAEAVRMLSPPTDPPDALYRLILRAGEEREEWAELTGVYANKIVAEETWADARGIRHSTINRRKSVRLDPDFKVAEAARKSILRKIAKPNYAVVSENYGPGHLVLVAPYQAYPLMDNDTVAIIQELIPKGELSAQKSFHWLWVVYQMPDYNDGINIVRSSDSQAPWGGHLIWQISQFPYANVDNL